MSIPFGGFITVLAGLLVFSLLVIFHEYGHFKVARWCGVRVERFSIGFGPVIFSRMRDGVQYAVSAFPLGGYVKMGGDDPRDRSKLQPGDFFLAAWWKRVLIALAGPGANFILAIALGIVLAWVGYGYPDASNLVRAVAPGTMAESIGLAPGDVITRVGDVAVTSRQDVYQGLSKAGDSEPLEVVVEREGAAMTLPVPEGDRTALFEGLEFLLTPTVGEVGIGTPAYRSGLAEGDVIRKVDDRSIQSWSELTSLIRTRPGEELTLTVERDSRLIEVTVTPMAQEKDGETIGILGITAAGQHTFRVRLGFLDGIRAGSMGAVTAVALTFEGLKNIVTNPSNLSQISGPVAIIEASGNAAQAGVDQLLSLAMLISVALMVFNLLPIPILDGGMVVLSVWEALQRRPVGERGLAVYQGIGMAVIGTLIIFVLVNDPIRIWQRQRAMDNVTEISP